MLLLYFDSIQECILSSPIQVKLNPAKKFFLSFCKFLFKNTRLPIVSGMNINRNDLFGLLILEK